MRSLARLALGLGVAAASTVHAAELLSFNDFSSTAGLTLAGVAGTTTTADGAVLRLTPSWYGVTGVAHSTSPVTLGASSSFSTTFQFRFTAPEFLGPGDGITFFLAAGTSGLGVNPGGWLGYAGVPQSVAIELDTYSNGTEAVFGDNDNGNHVAVDVGGNLTGYALASPYGVTRCDFSAATPYTAAGCMANGNLWTATIGYDGSMLNVYLKEGGNPVQHVIENYALDIGAALGTNQAYVGFTAATYAAIETHDIINWQFADTTELAPGQVSEPPSMALLGLGLAGLAAWQHRVGARSRERSLIMIGYIKKSLVALVVVAATHAAQAAVVYSNPWDNAAVDAGAYSQPSQQLAGEFLLDRSATLTSASWYGTMSSGHPLDTGDHWSFTVKILDNVGGLPGTLLNSTSVSAAATETAVIIENQRAYRFDADLSSMSLSGGTYWLSILNTGTPNTFRWTGATSGLGSAHSPGDAWYVWTEPGRAPMNFSLEGNVAPEPSTLALLGLGLAGLAAARRRKQ